MFRRRQPPYTYLRHRTDFQPGDHLGIVVLGGSAEYRVVRHHPDYTEVAVIHAPGLPAGMTVRFAPAAFRNAYLVRSLKEAR